MARISGVDLPRDKRVEVALTYIFGVGLSRARQALAATSVNPDTRVRDLTEEETTRLRDYVDRNYKVEGDLRRDISLDIRRLIEIGSYRGLRHKKNLPVRGQRTRQGVQGIPQEHALCRRAGRRSGGPQGNRAWREASGGVREGAGCRPRGGHPVSPGGGVGGQPDPRCDPDSPQRMSASEAEEGVDGSLHRSGLPVVPPRGHEAVPEGREMLHGKVPRAQAAGAAGDACAEPAQALGVRYPPAGKAEAPPDLRSAGDTIQDVLHAGGEGQGDHRRSAVAAAGGAIG